MVSSIDNINGLGTNTDVSSRYINKSHQNTILSEPGHLLTKPSDSTKLTKGQEVLDDTPVTLSKEDLSNVDIDYLVQVYQSISIPDISFKELRHRLSFLLAEQVASHPDWYSESAGVLMNTPKYIQYQLTCFAILYLNLHSKHQNKHILDNISRFRKGPIHDIGSLRDLDSHQTIWFSSKQFNTITKEPLAFPIYISHHPQDTDDIQLRFDQPCNEFANYMDNIEIEIGRLRELHKTQMGGTSNYEGGVNLMWILAFITWPEPVGGLFVIGLLHVNGILTWDSFNPRNGWLCKPCRRGYRAIQDCMGFRHILNRSQYYQRTRRVFNRRHRASPPMRLYHTTDCLTAIVTTGRMKRGSVGQVGAGIYFAYSLEDTTKKAITSGWCFECTVFTGEQYILNTRPSLLAYRDNPANPINFRWLLNPRSRTPDYAPSKRKSCDSVITTQDANPTGGEVTVYSWDQVILSRVCKISHPQQYGGLYDKSGPWFSVNALVENPNALSVLENTGDTLQAEQMLGNTTERRRDGYRTIRRGLKNRLYHGDEVGGGVSINDELTDSQHDT